MVVLVPNSEKSVDELINQLSLDNWNNWLGSFTEEELVIHLPKFRFMFNDSLNVPLTNMGMGIAFKLGEANFSKIIPGIDLAISRVLHKAFVDVDEEGTEAAAVTAVEIIWRESTSSGDLPKHFRANKPFLFVIKERDTNAIIFLGKVMDPVYVN
jgi:serpin B